MDASSSQVLKLLHGWHVFRCNGEGGEREREGEQEYVPYLFLVLRGEIKSQATHETNKETTRSQRVSLSNPVETI